AQADRSEQAGADFIREASAQRTDYHKGQAKGRQHQTGGQGILAVRTLQIEDQQEEDRSASNAIQQAAEIGEGEEAMAEQAQLHQRLLNARLQGDEEDQANDANNQHRGNLSLRQHREGIHTQSEEQSRQAERERNRTKPIDMLVGRGAD